MNAKLTAKAVKEKINGVDTVSVKNGVYTARRVFFYTHGRTAEDLVATIKEAFPEAKILDSDEVWKPFRGGASTANSSHWWVRFTL